MSDRNFFAKTAKEDRIRDVEAKLEGELQARSYLVEKHLDGAVKRLDENIERLRKTVERYKHDL